MSRSEQAGDVVVVVLGMLLVWVALTLAHGLDTGSDTSEDAVYARGAP